MSTRQAARVRAQLRARMLIGSGDETGLAAIEFALVFVLLFFFVLLLIYPLGSVALEKIAVEHVSNTVIRFASSAPNLPETVPYETGTISGGRRPDVNEIVDEAIYSERVVGLEGTACTTTINASDPNDSGYSFSDTYVNGDIGTFSNGTVIPAPTSGDQLSVSVSCPSNEGPFSVLASIDDVGFTTHSLEATATAREE